MYDLYNLEQTIIYMMEENNFNICILSSYKSFIFYVSCDSLKTKINN